MDETTEFQTQEVRLDADEKTADQLSNVDLPDTITNEWIEEALKEGKFVVRSIGTDGKEAVREVFIKRFPDNFATEKAGLIDNYGISFDLATLYHGTNAESLTSLARNGLFGKADHPTLSIQPDNEVRSTAVNRRSVLGKGIVGYFRVPWDEVNIVQDSFPETVGWPNVPYTGERPDIPSYLADEKNILYIPPERLIGVYIVDQNGTAHK